MTRKPNDWYHMTYDQQRTWERAERERQDLEYERDQAREEAERSDRRNKERIRQLKAEAEAGHDDRRGLENEMEVWRRIAAQRLAFINHKGLKAEFESWVADNLAMPDGDIIDDDDEGGE